jgi:DNA-binding MarR family transcriptional regulator
MTAAHPPTWPSSRVLAGWWPHLDRLRPRSLWLYHLLLHRVEAPVLIALPAEQERLARLLLEVLASPSSAGPATTARLAARLHFDPQLLRRLLADLEGTGLVRSAPGEAGWSLTSAGEQVAAGATTLRPLHERRAFYFTEPPDPGGRPRYIPLDRPPTSALSENDRWHFDVGVLRECAGQSAEWKRRHGFPVEVLGVADSSGEVGTGEPWEQVVIDRPEHLLVLFVLSGASTEETLLGLAVQPAGWHLQAERPVLALGDRWHGVLPELSIDLPPDLWRQAWRDWGQTHGLPPVEVEACHLEQKGAHLRVKAPQPLAERLRSSRGELKGETWVLAGEGRIHNAAVIELTDS